ncbi:SDR family oxidoreductase [bacterium]|nr:SDR family oxidoreductase [bacterium]
MVSESIEIVASLLLLGASGVIATAIRQTFESHGYLVIGTGRKMGPGVNVIWDPFVMDDVPMPLRQAGLFDAVCWAQGTNLNDSITQFKWEAHEQLYRANVGFILLTLSHLLSHHLLSTPARLCVISSIWQHLSRPQKLSYSISKSALQGLVMSLVADLGPKGHLINAVLPGAIDTPMTRAALTPEQRDRIESETPSQQLVGLDSVSQVVWALCAPTNTGVSGQFITCDAGFSNVRLL